MIAWTGREPEPAPNAASTWADVVAVALLNVLAWTGVYMAVLS